MEARPASQSVVTMTELVLPGQTNALNSVFGGVIMSWIDIAAAISAQRHCRSSVVTASIDALSFVAPVYVGWVVNLKASVNFTGRSSMEVGVRADAENPRSGQTFHVSSAYLTFVAIGSDGRPVEVPPVQPESPDEFRRFTEAQQRRAARLKLKGSR